MKYAFMTFSCPELELKEVLDVAKRTGYEGIEPRITAKHRHGIEVDIDTHARKDIRRMAEESGIALACIATSCVFADPEKASPQVEHAHAAIDLAADLGAPTIRVFGGQIGGGLDREAATQLVSSSLSGLAAHAEERGVTICMETHDDWCDPNHVAEVMERVGSPAVAVNWDIMHPVRTRVSSMSDAFEILKPWIRHVHVHDARIADDGSYTLDFSPIGTGYVDHGTALALLKQMGYRGYVSGEWINWADSYEVHLPRELAKLRELSA